MAVGVLATDPIPTEPTEAQPLTTRSRARRGWHGGVGLGYVGCARHWCEGSTGLAGLDLSFGYRWNRFEPVLSIDGAIGGFKEGLLGGQLGIAIEEARLSSLGVGLGVLLFPRFKERGVADPYFDLGLGFSGVWLKFAGSGLEVRDWVPRGSIRIGAGVDFFGTERFSIGPGFRVSIPFAGRECLEIRGLQEPVDECISMRRLEEEYGYPASELPLVWAVMLRGRFIWTG